MNPGKEEFFVVGGGGDPSVVLLPGWATDGRVFEGVLPGVTAVTTGPLRTDGFSRRLAAFLGRAARGPVTVVGWSLGGFIAAEFAREYPDRVRRVVLVGIRRGYPAAVLSAVLASLLRDREACLSTFYAQCFIPAQTPATEGLVSRQAGMPRVLSPRPTATEGLVSRQEGMHGDLLPRPPAYRRFRGGLQAAYLREIDVGVLREGLSYLASARLSGETLPECPVAVVHGEKDVVAPLAEAEGVAMEGGNATFHPLPGAAHAAFLADGFRAVVADG
jgi:pimeloyl-ACP methyl ester carboxylesterase